MRRNSVHFFIYSAGVILMITAGAKLVSSEGSAHILRSVDPLLQISFQHLFWLVGTLELAVALVCFLGRHPAWQAGLIAWLASTFLIYRLGLSWVGYQKPCSCLGNLTDALHLSPRIANTFMEIVLGYLLIGSYFSLLWIWMEKRKSGAAAPMTGVPASSSK